MHTQRFVVAAVALLFWLIGAIRQACNRPLRAVETAALAVLWAAIVLPSYLLSALPCARRGAIALFE